MENQKKVAFDLTLREIIGISILGILYLVGTLGIGLELNSSIVKLTPVNLIISLIIISYFHSGKLLRLLLLLSVCFLVGFLIEMIGVQTGLIFGEYSYGTVLGPKFNGTPFLIGINWAMLIYAAGSTINLFFPNWNIWIKAIYSALCLVFLDYLIEPVAMKLEFWNWAQDVVPFQNYLAWGVISLVLSLFFFKTFKTESNKVAYALFILQFVFFGMLNLLLNS